jgi:hypothetical protein
MNSSSPLLPFHLFDHEAEVQIVKRRLPHWSQAGAICFITWRTLDSMPKKILDQWYGDRTRWLQNQGINPEDPFWRHLLQRLDPKLAQEFQNSFWNRWHDALDASQGLVSSAVPNWLNWWRTASTTSMANGICSSTSS